MKPLYSLHVSTTVIWVPDSYGESKSSIFQFLRRRLARPEESSVRFLLHFQ